MSKKPKLFLFDGNSFIHRAANTMPAFSNKAGHPTGVIVGFLNMMTSVLNRYNPEKTIVNFDHKGKNFRHELLPSYKGNRPPTDPEISAQFQPVKDIVKAWGLPIISIKGVEADDTMGTLADIGVEEGYDVYIVTSDKDMRQKVKENISILDTKDAEKKGKPLDAQGVFDKMGVYPDRVIDLLSIMGDASDNVPGAVGVGEVTAAKWIAKFGSLDGIIENIHTVKGAYAQKFQDQIEQVRLSYKLVTIDSNVDLGVEFKDIVGEKDDDELFRLIQEYELKKFQLAIGAKNTNAEELSINIIDLDNENTSALNIVIGESGDNLFVESHQDDLGLTLFISPAHDENVYKVTACGEIARMVLCRPCLSGNDIKQTLKHLVELSGVKLNTNIKVMDTRVFNYNINGGRTKKVGLDEINQIEANIELSELRVTHKLDTEKPKWEKLQFEELLQVKAEEVLIAKKTLLSQSHKDLLQLKPLNVDYQLIPVIALMEINGVYVNKDILETLNVEYKAKLIDIEFEIYDIAGDKFNIGSHKQVKEVLFDKLGIPSRNRKTDEKEMTKLSKVYPICGLIMQWRSLSKLISTYIVGIMNRADEESRVHANFNQTVVTSSRLSADDPNLQSIPVATDMGKRIRTSFEAKERKKIIALDYSQIEMRVLAHFSKQPELVYAFNNNIDVHVSTAADVFDMEMEAVGFEKRRAAKAINFGLIYGLGAKALAKDLGISIAEAKDYIEKYFNKYNLVKPYMDSILDFAKENLFVVTDMGRKLLTRNVNTTNNMAKPHEELSAKNAPLQGTAADIMKLAMIEVAKYIFENKDKYEITLLMQVHDELVIEADDDIAEIIANDIAEIMENVVQLVVPLKVDYAIADNWADAH